MFYGDKTRFVGAPFSIKNEIRVAKNCNTPLSPYNLLVPRLLFSGAFFRSLSLALAFPFLMNFLFLPCFHSFSLFFQVGHKRFLGGIMVVFSMFNDLADFKGRVNNIVGWFDNIDRFMHMAMGSGGNESESQISVQQINELKTRLNDLATDVESKIEHRMFMFTMYNGFASLREKLDEMKHPSLYVWYTMPEFCCPSQSILY